MEKLKEGNVMYGKEGLTVFINLERCVGRMEKGSIVDWCLLGSVKIVSACETLMDFLILQDLSWFGIKEESC